MSADSATIKLSGDNWPVWKFQTIIMLKGRSLFDIVEGTRAKPLTTGEPLNKWLKDDAKAQELLVTKMEQGPLSHLLSCETAHDMWNKLKSVFDKESVVSIHLLQQRFFLLEFDSSVANFISQIEEIKTKLKTAGETLSDKMIMTKILMSLPEKYKHFRSAWESVPADNQNLEELTSRLLLEEERFKSFESTTASTTALNAKAHNTSHNNRVPSRVQTSQRCYVCSKVGHLAKNCFFRNRNPVNRSQESKKTKYCTFCKKSSHNIEECWLKRGKESRGLSSKKEDEQSDNNAFMVYTEKLKTGDWCLDSGASEHMCWDKNNFDYINALKIKKMIQVGNGQKLEVKGIGQITLWAYNGEKLIKTTLSNVLFVPELKFNLFSAGCALDKGNCVMISDHEKCQFIDKFGKARALATRVDKLYKMHFTTENKEYNPSACFSAAFTTLDNLDPYECMKVRTIDSIEEWHYKLSHQNLKHIREFLKRNKIEYTDCEKEFVCEACLAGKQHRLVFENSESRATAPLELVHADICGPMENTSLGGSRYFLLLKDDFSSYRYVYFLKQKSEVKLCIDKFINLAERETGHKMKVLRTDNGLEFLNKEIKESLEQKGIRHQRTVVYTPQQNGRAERENRTLVEAARTLLNGHKKMDKAFWAEAINTATYTLNRTGPSPQKLKSPYELWYKKIIDIHNFKVFGCAVSVHIPKETRLKWDPKSKQGIFVGYGEDVKGYRVYIPEKEKVETHRDIIFLPEKTKKENDTVKINEEITKNSSENSQNEEEETENDSQNEDNESSSENDNDDAVMQYEMINNRYDLRRERRRNTRYDDYEMDMDRVLMMMSDEDIEVMCYDDAIASSDSGKWKEAIKTEINALEENDTWFSVSESEINNKAIECKWVFKRKMDELGNVTTYKARLVARGFQQNGMYNYDSYSPVAKLPSVRIFLALCNNFNYKVTQLDVCSAFLNGDINDDVFIVLPQGFDKNEGKIVKLRKSLYGLKASPKNWYKKFHDLMLSLNFVRSENEYCIYIKITESYRIFILLYVDDLLLAGNDEQEINIIKKVLNNNFKMKDLGPFWHFLGMRITQNLAQNKITINQTTYLKNILKRFNMEDCKPCSTPMEPNFRHDELKRDQSESKDIENNCRRAIGSLMYAMLCSRPDLCLCISILSRYQSFSSLQLWQAIKRVLRYVQGTLELSLVFHKSIFKNLVEGYADSDWAGDRVDRKSTSGYIFKVFGCTTSWCSRKQSTVALSSTEAEYVALSLAVSEACWLKNMMFDLKIPQTDCLSVVIFEDNQSAIKVCKNPEFHKRLKHVDIRYHFIRDKVKDKVVTLKYISTSNQIADFLTKPLSLSSFQKFCSKCNLE